MTTPAFPTNAQKARVRFYWWGQDGGGSGKKTTFRPTATDLTDMSAFGYIETETKTVLPDETSALVYADVICTNDPDLTPFLWEVTREGQTPKLVEVSVNAPVVDVGGGVMMPAVWLTDAATADPPPDTPDTFYNSAQTDAAVVTGVEVHNEDTTAHADIRALASGATVPDATTTTKGKSKLLGGTADAPTVPYSAVTGTPTSLPPSGPAGGVLAGNFPNPGFAVNMAEQSELDAAIAAVPAQARDAVGAALVQGSGITITVNDAADTITIAATATGPSYTDEQVQDVVAALLAAGTQSGITFTYDDAGNALSATVSAQSWSQITGKPTFSSVATSGSASDITTGTLPDSVIPSGIARDSEVTAAIQAVVGTAPANLDTLQEIATQLANDESAASALTTTVAGKLAKTANLSDLASASTARTNLGLSTVAASGAYADLSGKPTIPSGVTSVRAVSANTTAVVGELLSVDATSASRTITPPSSPVSGAQVTVVKVDASANPVVWNGVTNGDSSAALASQWAGAQFTWDGAKWVVTAVNVAGSSSVAWASVTGKPTFATIATSGSYTDLSSKPTIPSVPSDIGAQPADSDLTAIAALAPADGAFIGRQSGVWTGRTPTQARTDLGVSATGDLRADYIYRPENYGAVGDGSTDDSGAFTAMFADIPSTGGTVLLGTKTYKWTSAVTCSKPVALLGMGHGTVTGNGSRINYIPATGVALTLSAPGSQVRDLTIERAAFLTTRATAGAGLRMSACTHTEVTRVLIQGFWNNLEMLEGEYYNVSDCKLLDFANYGLQLAHDSSPDHGDQSIVGNHIGKFRDPTAGGTAVHWQSGGGVRFQNNKINAYYQTDYSTTARLAKGLHLDIADTTSTSVFPIVGNSIENFTEQGIYVTGNTGNIDRVTITANEIASFGGGVCIELAQASFIYSCNITANTLGDCNTAIKLSRIRESSVVGNSGTAVATYGIRCVFGIVATTFADNKWPSTCTYPWYFDNTGYPPLSDNDFSTALFFNSATTPLDLFEIGCAQYGRVFAEVEITGGVDSVSANAYLFKRLIQANANGQDAGQLTIGTDFDDGGGNMTAAIITAGLANPVARLQITRSGGNNINLTVKLRVYGQGLTYVKQLISLDGA